MNISIILNNIQDPRRNHLQKHSLETIIYITLAAVIGGAESWYESKRIRDAALSTFIHHYTFAAKSKSIKYDSRRTIRVGMETIPCTTQ